MSGKTRQPKKGSYFSRIRHNVRNKKEQITNFFRDETRTKTQKLKNVRKGYWNSTKKSFINAADSNKTKLAKIGHGVAGVGKVIVGAPVALGAAALGTVTTTLGAATRVAAPIAGTALGTSAGLVKGALELATRAPYGVGKALYHSPTAVYRGIKYSLAKKAFQLRTGFSNETKKKIQTLEAKKSKAATNLEELIKKQDEKLEKIKLGDTKTVERKLAKYEAQREKLAADIATREAKLQNKTRKALNKTRSAKEKRGETTQFTLNATKREQLTPEAIAKRFGVLKKSGETNIAFQERLKYTDDSIKDYSKRTGIKMFKGESDEAYKRRVGISSETNEEYGARIGVKKKEGELNEAYKARLNSYKKKAGENNTAYLKRRLEEQYKLQKEAYNNAITKDVIEKQEDLKKEIGTQQDNLKKSKEQLLQANDTITEYRNKNSKTQDDIAKYLDAIKTRSKATSTIRLQELVIAQKNKKLLEAQAEEQRLINTKGLNAKRGSMERRRTRLEESKQNLADAGRHFVSPVVSPFFGAKTGYKIGTTIGQQARKYGSFGMIEEKISSNSGKGIRKSFNRFRNLGLGTNKKQNKNKEVENEVNKQKKVGVFTRKLNSKKTIKNMNIRNLSSLANKLDGFLTNIKTSRIPKLNKLRNRPNLSIQQKIKIDNLISQFREESKKYEKALLRVMKRFPADNFRSARYNPTQPQSNLKSDSTPPKKNRILYLRPKQQETLNSKA